MERKSTLALISQKLMKGFTPALLIVNVCLDENSGMIIPPSSESLNLLRMDSMAEVVVNTMNLPVPVIPVYDRGIIE